MTDLDAQQTWTWQWLGFYSSFSLINHCSTVEKSLYSPQLLRNGKLQVNVANSIKSEAYKLVFWQLFVVMGLALILFLFKGLQSGISSLLGGLAYCVPNLMFVWRVFSRTSAQAARSFLVAFLAGEVSKLFLSALLFVLIVKYLAVDFKFVLAGYICAIMAFWLVSFIFLAQEHPREDL